MLTLQGQLPTEHTSDLRIALVTSRFNEHITTALHEGAVQTLLAHNIVKTNLLSCWVPGAIELPVAIKRLLLRCQIDGVIALGSVIQGKTKHFDYVCQQVNDGIGQLSLEFDVPISFGVLMTLDYEQALARVGHEKGHKGRESAEALLETIDLLSKIDNL
jgi:6,7-dimethyl-8-ribityllumazine synthase